MSKRERSDWSEKYYISQPWKGLLEHGNKVDVPAEVIADRDRRLSVPDDPARKMLGDPPRGYVRTELRRVDAPSTCPTLGIGIVTKRKPHTIGNVRDWMKISLPRVSIQESEPA